MTDRYTPDEAEPHDAGTYEFCAVCNRERDTAGAIPSTDWSGIPGGLERLLEDTHHRAHFFHHPHVRDAQTAYTQRENDLMPLRNFYNAEMSKATIEFQAATHHPMLHLTEQAARIERKYEV